MSKQITRYKCPTCGAIFDGAQAFADHLEAHELHPASLEDLREESPEELALEYSHADREFRIARLPIFGAALVFLSIFGVAAAFHLGWFLPMYVSATAAAIIGLAFLFKFLMEG